MTQTTHLVALKHGINGILDSDRSSDNSHALFE